MSNSTGTRKERNVQSRANESLLSIDEEFIKSLKIFADSSNETAGLAGGSINNSPITPAGNYLARKGDFMIGPIGYGPPPDFTVDVTALDSINISPDIENPQYSSNLQLDDLQTNSSVLTIIIGANFDGQILVLRTFAPTVPYTIKQGTLGNGGNIQTLDGDDLTVGDLQTINLIYDESLKIGAGESGTWRVVTGGLQGGTVPPATAQYQHLEADAALEWIPQINLNFGADHSTIASINNPNDIFGIAWRNNGDTADIGIKVDTNDRIIMGADVDMQTFDIRRIDRAIFEVNENVVSGIADPQIYAFDDGSGDPNLVFNTIDTETFIWTLSNERTMDLSTTTLQKQGENLAQTIKFLNITTPPATGTIGTLAWDGVVNGPITSRMAFISGSLVDTSTGDGSMDIGVSVAGTPTDFLRLNVGKSDHIDALKILDMNTNDIDRIDRARFISASTVVVSNDDPSIFAGALGSMIYNATADTNIGHFWSTGDIVRAALVTDVAANVIFDVRSEDLNGAATYQLIKSNTSPAIGLTLGQIQWLGTRTGNSALVNYGAISVEYEDISVGTHSGSMRFAAFEGGSEKTFAHFNNGNTGTLELFVPLELNNNIISNMGGGTINDLTDIGTPVGADELLIFDASAPTTLKKVLVSNLPGGAGANTSLSNLVSVAVNTTLVSDTDLTDDLGTTLIAWRELFVGDITMRKATQPLLEMFRDDSTPNDGDTLGSIDFAGNDSASGKEIFAQIQGISSDVTQGTEDGSLAFSLIEGGAVGIKATLSNDGLFSTEGGFAWTGTGADMIPNGSDIEFRLGSGNSLTIQEVSTAFVIFDGSANATIFSRDVFMNNGDIIKAGPNPGDITSFQVTNDTFGLGDEGSIQAPILTQNANPTDADLDDAFGDGDGCCGFFDDANSTTNKRWYARSADDGLWYFATMEQN